LKTKKLSKSEVFSILDDVEATFATGLSKAGSKLAKSEEYCDSDEDKEEKKKKKEDEDGEEGEDMNKSEKGKEHASHDSHELSKSEGYTSEDFTTEVEELYSSMTKSERAIHANALNGVLNAAHMAKSEENVGTSMQKSEREVELEGQVETLSKSVDSLVGKLENVLGINSEVAPEGKAVMSMDYMTKSEGANGVQNGGEIEITPETIKTKLTSLAKNESTSDEDRESINEYYCNGRNINAIKHLLK